MIKVGLFIDSYYPMMDGVTTVVHNYARRLQDDGFDMTVFCPTVKKGYPDDFNYAVKRCKSFSCSFLDYRAPAPMLDAKFKKALEGSDLDLVHIHSPFAVGDMGLKYAKRHDIPVIATMHTQFKRDFMRATHSRLLTKLLVKRIVKVFDGCDRCYAVNNAVADIYLQYGVKNRPYVLRNCTDFEEVRDTAAARSYVDGHFNIPHDIPMLLFVGRMTKLKNIPFLLESMSYLQTPAVLVLAGGGRDLPALKGYAKKIAPHKNKIFTDSISDRELLRCLYSEAKLFLFPSEYDASSVVQIEAASQKTPTVFIRGAATADGIEDGINGYLSEASPRAYAAKIDEILQSETSYAKVCEGAFRDIYRTWDDHIGDVKKIYAEMVGK